MTRESTLQPPATSRRGGFTLIELLVVMLIIAALAAMIIPAVNSVVTRTRITAAKSEMSNIGTSIADFESEFGKQPPSYISFVPDGSGNLPAQTKAMLRSMFPQISFDGTGGTLQTSLDTAGLLDEELQGIEALVFFLGGIRKDANGNGTVDENDNDTIDDGDEVELVGFSKNPANPFAQPASAQSTRIGPLFDFDTERLVNLDDDNTLEYMDSLEGQTSPLAYVSTALTSSYVPGHANLPPYTPDGGGTPIPWEPYQKSDGDYYEPTTYQLISPGYDGAYGKGGVFNDSTTLAPPDMDNLTNFSEGELGG